MATIAPDEPLAVGSDQDGGTARTLLHTVTDWPGHVPNGPASARMAELDALRGRIRDYRTGHAFALAGRRGADLFGPDPHAA